jgi:S1-C subfamily serine protease
MSADLIEQMSDALADRVAAAAASVVAVSAGHRHRSGILWQPDVVVTSEQCFGEATAFGVMQAGRRVTATLIGRDPGTNVAALRLEAPLACALPASAPAPRVGSLALVLGADAAGAPTGRLAMLHAVGAAWHSLAGGRIDALLRLDTRLGADEGGPVLTPGGGLLGMSTAGPRRRALVIPAATIAHVLPALLEHGHVPRGWLGVGLQPVAVPDSLRGVAGAETGMLVVSLADGAPAVLAGILPGDIVLEVDGSPVRRARAFAAALGPDRIGQPVAVRLLRGGEERTVSVTIMARPAR